ncbi:UNVERIFIED_CONTAM: hypothetical protein RMT77_014204 [Armadillidium vulgare]
MIPFSRDMTTGEDGFITEMVFKVNRQQLENYYGLNRLMELIVEYIDTLINRNEIFLIYFRYKINDGFFSINKQFFPTPQMFNFRKVISKINLSIPANKYEFVFSFVKKL